MTLCPSCKDVTLRPERLEPTLPALGCASCGGSLLSLVAYRHWREQQPTDPSAAAPAVAAEAADTPSALCCPKCARFMTKYRVSAEARNHIDLCTHCDEVWLDRGEWELLEQLALAGRLTQVFTQPWQQRLRSEEVQRLAEARWREQLGDDYARAREIREWIAAHRTREVLAYLSQVQTYSE